MTGKQIEEAEDMLPKWVCGTPPQLTPEQKITARELACRHMINSSLIYGDNSFYNEEKKEFVEYSRSYTADLGIEEVTRIWNEQLEDFAKAKVQHGVHTDSEGGSYNSCKWADD